MEHMSCSILLFILLVMNLRNLYSAMLPCEGKGSQICPPGTFYNTRNCTGCVPCPRGSYSNEANKDTFCNKCRICKGVLVYKTSCTSTQNAACECATGFKCQGENCKTCSQNCEVGQEPAEDGCKTCPPGTFTNQIHISCVAWSNCTYQGHVILKNGTSKTDVVCGPSPSANVPVDGIPYKPEGDIMVHVVLIVLSVLFVICVVIFTMHIMVWSKKKVKDEFKPVPNTQLMQTAQQEDACSYHFPEEEEGEAATPIYQTAISA